MAEASAFLSPTQTRLRLDRSRTENRAWKPSSKRNANKLEKVLQLPCNFLTTWLTMI
jgi:hypothetical protein